MKFGIKTKNIIKQKSQMKKSEKILLTCIFIAIVMVVFSMINKASAQTTVECLKNEPKDIKHIFEKSKQKFSNKYRVTVDKINYYTDCIIIVGKTVIFDEYKRNGHNKSYSFQLSKCKIIQSK